MASAICRAGSGKRSKCDAGNASPPPAPHHQDRRRRRRGGPRDGTNRRGPSVVTAPKQGSDARSPHQGGVATGSHLVGGSRTGARPAHRRPAARRPSTAASALRRGCHRPRVTPLQVAVGLLPVASAPGRFTRRTSARVLEGIGRLFRRGLRLVTPCRGPVARLAVGRAHAWCRGIDGIVPPWPPRLLRKLRARSLGVITKRLRLGRHVEKVWPMTVWMSPSCLQVSRLAHTSSFCGTLV